MWTTLFEYSLLRLENSISTGNTLLCTTFTMLLDSLCNVNKMWKHFIYIKRCHGNKHLYMCVYSCFTSRFIFHGLTTSHIYLWIYIVDFCGLYIFLLFLLFLWFLTIASSFRQQFPSPFNSSEFSDEIIDGATTAPGLEPMYVFFFFGLISVRHPLQWWLIIRQ